MAVCITCGEETYGDFAQCPLCVLVEPIEVVHEHSAIVEAARVEARVEAARVCPKCNGEGKLPQHWRVANGNCFKCGGTGRVH